MIPEFWSELPEIVRTLDDAGEARAIVISSTGKHFTAGMDLAVFTSANADDRDARDGPPPRQPPPRRPAAPGDVLAASTARGCPCSPRCRAAASAAAST